MVGLSGQGLVGEAWREGSLVRLCRDLEVFPKCDWGAVGSFEQAVLSPFKMSNYSPGWCGSVD